MKRCSLFPALPLLLLAVLPLRAGEPVTLESLQREIQELRKTHETERAAQQREIVQLREKLTEMRSDRGELPPEKIEKNKDLLNYSMNYRSDGLLKAGGLKFGAYGEMLYRARQGAVSGFDPRRIVLLPSYAVNDWINFNSEIEIEHGGAGVDFTNDGNVEIEQAYLDFLFNEHFNWRSLGLDVVPIGRLNLFHEPTLFYSTDRPELYSELIPSTWTEGATSIFGKIVDGLQYQVMISSGLEDRSAANGINGVNGLRGARPSTGQNFNQTNGTPAITTRLAYQPPWVPGLDGSTSWHHSEASSSLSAYAIGGDLNVNLMDTELRYRIPRTGWELRADGALALIGRNGSLQANNDGDPTNNVGTRMWGAYGEVAYHFWPEAWNHGRSRGMDFVPFARYTHLDLQSGPSGGADVTASTGGNDREYYTFGFAFFPTHEIVLKMDYRLVHTHRTSGDPTGAERDQLQLAADFFF